MTYDTLLIQERPGVLHFGGARMALLDIEAGFWGLRRQIEALVGRRLADAVLQQAGANGGASFARAFAGEGAAEDGAQALRDCVAAYQAAGFGRFEIVESEWPFDCASLGFTRDRQGRPPGRVLIRAQDAFEAWMVRRHGDQAEAPVCAYTAGVLVGFVNVLVGRQDVVCIERACQAQGAESCLFELLPAQAAAGAPVVAFAPDPALGREINLLETLFERMPMGIAVFDQSYHIRRYNPTWADFSGRYGPPSGAPLAPGVYYFDLLPGSEPIVMPLFERVLAGETIRQDALRFESGGIVSYWDVVLAPLVQDGEIGGILNVTIDATGRVQAHRELEKALERLRQREERLALVMEGINDGVWDWDIEAGRVYFSPRWKSMLGYAEDEIPNEFEAWEELIHSDDRERAAAALREHLDGRTPLYRLEHRLRHRDGDYRWILARGTALRRDDGTPYRLVGSHTDITERRRAQAIQEGQRHFLELLATGGEFSETLHTLVRIIEEQWPGMLGLVLLLDEDRRHLHVGASVSLPEAYVASIEGLEIGPRVGSCGTASYLGQRVIVEDIDTDERWDGLRSLAQAYGLRACWSEPVFSPAGDVVGTFAMYYHHRRAPTEAELRTIETAAHLVGVAIETRRIQEALREAYETLEQRVQERTRELSTLLEVSHNISSTLDLGSLLERVLDQLGTVVEYTGASVLTLDGEHLAVRAYRGPVPQGQMLALRFPLERALANREVILRREPVIISDVHNGTPLARLFQSGAGDALDTTFAYVRSWLGLPLMVQDRVLGMLTLDHGEPDFFTARHAGLVQAFANQVAVAIENARLHAQAQDAAVAAERSRLARDLHDAVTQTLFSSSLIAEVLPRLWERNPDEGRRRLAELRELTRGALAEMRTLLLELRPLALEEANLGDLLRQLAESITGRARVPVTLEVEGECALETGVKIALYRIAQEALNNVAKHAGATAATMRLSCRPGQVELRVRDDGIGFDPAHLSPNSLGLGIMRERAEAIGAALAIDSQPGLGTQIKVLYKSSGH